MKLTKILGLAAVGLLALQAPLALAAEQTATNTMDIEFLDNDGPTNPKDPIKPDIDDDYEPEDPDEITGNNGPLSIDYISNFHFGQQKMSGNKSTFKAKLTKNNNGEERPNFLALSDHRGNGNGWTVTVAQAQPLTSGANTIAGTSLVMSNGYVNSVNGNGADISPLASQKVEVTPGGAAVTVVSAAGGGTKGMGSWTNAFGSTNDQGKDSVELNIPANTKIAKGAYETELTWTLSDTPGN